MINNAAHLIYAGAEDEKPLKTKDGYLEMTFMVNVVAPYHITKRILLEMKNSP